MPRIVILGAGFAGLAAAAGLDYLAAEGKVELVLIDKSAHFSMGFSMQWVLAGRRKPGEGQKPYADMRM